METATLDEVLAAKNAASDGAYILAQTSGGETVRISKADLASVVAGVMGNPIGSVKSVSNADDVFENGIYHVAQGASGSIQNVVLSVFKSPLVVSGKYFISQIAHGTGNEVKMRQMWYGSSSSEWSAWQRIDNFGCNTLEELAAALQPYLR